jgi:hypothetical protein
LSTTSANEQGWPAGIHQAGLPLPELDKITLEGVTFAYFWPSHYVLANPEPIPAAARDAAEAAGMSVVQLPASGFDLPAALVDLLKG